MRFSMLYSGEQILSFKSCLVFYAGDSLKCSMGDTTFPELFLFFPLTQTVSRLSKSQTYFSPDLSPFPWFGLIGIVGGGGGGGCEPCLPSNAYFPGMPGNSLSFRVNVYTLICHLSRDMTKPTK